MSDIRPEWDFEYANGAETGTTLGSAPGCTNKKGDGTFGEPSTGCNKQCPGCGGDWCCDCNGCKPGKCDEEPANSWCQDYYETWGRVAAGCPPPNDDPCYEIDPITSRWVANTDPCFCPGADRIAGKTCNPSTGNWDTTQTTWGTSPTQNTDPSDDGPRSGNPNLPTDTVCYLKSVEVFGDYTYHQVPCHCRVLGTPEAIRKCLEGVENPGVDGAAGVAGCDCTASGVGTNTVQVFCRETINGIPTGAECDPVECNCHNDCLPGQTCNEYGECV